MEDVETGDCAGRKKGRWTPPDRVVIPGPTKFCALVRSAAGLGQDRKDGGTEHVPHYDHYDQYRSIPGPVSSRERRERERGGLAGINRRTADESSI